MERQQILIGDNLRLERINEEVHYVCSCGHSLGTGKVNFKDGCKVQQSPTSSIGPGYASSDPEMAGKMCFREFFCPACGIRQATEIARIGDPFLWDIQPRL